MYSKFKSTVCITRGGPDDLIPPNVRMRPEEDFTKWNTCYNASGVDIEYYDNMHHLFSDL